MKQLKKIKRKIGLSVEKNPFLQFFYKYLIKVNYYVFHRNERRRIIINNKHDDVKYYIIRSRGRNDGLISTYYYVLANVVWAISHKLIPIVDFTDDNQYLVDYSINGTKNAWEYYFEQPCGIGMESIKNSDNYIVSGWSFNKKDVVPPITRNQNTVRSKELRNVVNKYGRIKKYILEQVQVYKNESFIHNRTLGVYIRGTDYVALRPKGHYIQPNVEDVIEKIHEFIEKYLIEILYIVTEDNNIYQTIKKEFSAICISHDDDFIRNYSKKDFLAEEIMGDGYTRGLNYLERLLLLRECDYLIASITNGSLFVLNSKEDEYLDCYLFDIGVY